MNIVSAHEIESRNHNSIVGVLRALEGVSGTFYNFTNFKKMWQGCKSNEHFWILNVRMFYVEFTTTTAFHTFSISDDIEVSRFFDRTLGDNSKVMRNK